MNLFKFISTKVIAALLYLTVLLGAPSLQSAEYHVAGLIDVRASNTKGFNSYLTGDYGKFRYSDGSAISLAQLALSYRVDWENNLQFILVLNGYGDGESNGVGVTEGYFRYRSLPDVNGLRYQFRVGIMYPKISLENIATGWSSPYTLSYSTMNSWIGEEVRHLGIEGSISRLGKINGSEHDFTLTAALFSFNDPNGAMLAWHGWTQSSRQSFWGEKLKFPEFPALNTALSEQARESKPFDEVDSNIGYHLNAEWKWRGKGKAQIGWYDNQGGTHEVKNGQYAWITRFVHFGIKWKLSNDLVLISQLMSGDSRMRVDQANPFNAVAIDFDNAFIMLSKKWNKNRFSARVEKFDIRDFDSLVGDDNNENGKAFTLSYAYQMNKNLFLHIEYNQIDSVRPSRSYNNLAVDAKEQQWQLAARYFF